MYKIVSWPVMVQLCWSSFNKNYPAEFIESAMQL